MTRLSAASAVLVTLLVIHALDHTLRQDTPVPDALGAVGLAGTAAAVVVLTLTLLRRPLAGPAAFVLGAATAR